MIISVGQERIETIREGRRLVKGALEWSYNLTNNIYNIQYTLYTIHYTAFTVSYYPENALLC